MGYFCILEKSNSNYCGLDRKEINPEDNHNIVISLWDKYVQDYDTDKFLCASSQMTLDELKELANTVNRYGRSYELVYFDEKINCPYESHYLGIDIVTASLRSNLKEGMLYCGNKTDCEDYQNYYYVNEKFKKRLNNYGLFPEEKTAREYYNILLEYNERFKTGEEPWHLMHVYLVYI